MSNLFSPTLKQDIQQKFGSGGVQPGAPKPDTSAMPQGQPVPALQQIGYHNGIASFNTALQAVVDAHQRKFGFEPDPATALHTVVTTPPDQVHNAFGAPPTELHPIQTSPELLRSIVAFANNDRLDQWYQLYGDSAQAMLSDPTYGPQMQAAMSKAENIETLRKRQAAGGSLSDVTKGIALSGPKAALWSVNTTLALAHDTTAATEWAGTGGRKGSIAFPELTKTAPAVAQVVKGLVYSPVGVARIVEAVAKDTRNAATGNFSFEHTRAIARSTGQQFLEDIGHPSGRWGYLFLDGLAIGALGAGTAARAGRAAGTLGEGGTVGEAARAFTAPHPTRTYTLSKDGYSAQIRLAQSPLMRKAQQRWLDVQQARMRPAATDLFGNDIERLFPTEGVGSYPARLLKWATEPLSGERMIGRAENIRMQTEMRALGGLATLLNDAAGSAARRTRLETLIPDKVFKGLTVGEMKALESMSYDIHSGLDPLTVQERNAQFALENGIGDGNAWRGQIAKLALARHAMENPSPRFLKAVDAVRAVTAQTEAIKADAEWLSGQTMENRVVKAGALVEHFPELAPQIKEHLAAKAALERIQGIVRKSPELGELRVGGYVRPVDRNNVGRITEIRDGEATVHFHNKEKGTRQTLDFPLSDLRTELEAAQAEFEANPYPFRNSADGGLEARIGGAWVPLNRNRPDSWYFPLKPKGKTNKPPTLTWARTSDYGLSPAMLPPELRHEMTGVAYLHGDYRLDIHHLAGEQLARTAKAFVQWQQWLKAWENASETKRDGYIAVRDIRSVPDELRRALNQFLDEHIDLRSVDALPEDLQRVLFPADEEIAAGDHVRWIDPRLLGHTATRFRGDHFRLFEHVNNALRPLIFYLYPKYALNAVGNAAMLALDEGFARSYNNLVRAMRIEQDSVGDDAALIKAAVGEGKSASYAVGTSQKVNRALADFWNHLTDEKFRVAAFLHYADIKGYKTAEARHELLTDAGNKADLVDVTRRANESLVAFDRMSPGERAWLRHHIFVYPWQRGAFLWSFRTLFEHPAKTALLATLGQDAYHDEKWLKDAVAWVRRTGYLPLGWAGDKLHVYSPSSINTWQVLSDVLQVIKAETTGDKYAAAGDLLGPPAQAATHAALGVDEFGNRYTGSHLEQAIKGALGTVPLIAILDRKHKPQEPLPKLNIADRRSLIARYHAYLNQAATSPGWLDGFGRLLWGADSYLNMPAVVERYWRDATPRQRQQREVALINDMLTQQGHYLNRQVPKAVRQAVTDQSQYAYAVHQFLQKEHRTSATLKERLTLLIDYYRHAGRIDGPAAAKLSNQIAGMEDPREIRSTQAKLAIRYGHALELAVWDRDVRQAAGAVANFGFRTVQLHGMGLADKASYTVTHQQKVDYARAYVNYLDGRRQIQKEYTGKPDLAAQLAMYDDEHDRPVGQLPSVVRFAFKPFPLPAPEPAPDFTRIPDFPTFMAIRVRQAISGRLAVVGARDALAAFEEHVDERTIAAALNPEDES